MICISRMTKYNMKHNHRRGSEVILTSYSPESGGATDLGSTLDIVGVTNFGVGEEDCDDAQAKNNNNEYVARNGVANLHADFGWAHSGVSVGTQAYIRSHYMTLLVFDLSVTNKCSHVTLLLPTSKSRVLSGPRRLNDTARIQVYLFVRVTRYLVFWWVEGVRQQPDTSWGILGLNKVRPISGPPVYGSYCTLEVSQEVEERQLEPTFDRNGRVDLLVWLLLPGSIARGGRKKRNPTLGRKSRLGSSVWLLLPGMSEGGEWSRIADLRELHHETGTRPRTHLAGLGANCHTGASLENIASPILTFLFQRRDSKTQDKNVGKCTRICVVEAEWKIILEKTNLSTSNRDSNFDLTTIGSLHREKCVRPLGYQNGYRFVIVNCYAALVAKMLGHLDTGFHTSSDRGPRCSNICCIMHHPILEGGQV
uniref:(California timema) hypothetical protein n=1 Tax=Timema californicum TaxID=61474 RepID=A0A7R9P798_TIMCA|nr:unnamed protein product [Timema californicum]